MVKGVSLGRSSLSWRVLYWRFHCIPFTALQRPQWWLLERVLLCIYFIPHSSVKHISCGICDHRRTSCSQPSHLCQKRSNGVTLWERHDYSELTHTNHFCSTCSTNRLICKNSNKFRGQAGLSRACLYYSMYFHTTYSNQFIHHALTIEHPKFCTRINEWLTLNYRA